MKSVRAAVALILFQTSLLSAQANISFTPAARIDEASLGGLISSPIILSFDLSPDGNTVALLVSSGLGKETPFLLVTQDLTTKRTAARQLGPLTITNSNFAPQVRYASDGHYLVVQDYQTVRVLDSKTFEPLRTISAPSDKEPLIPLFVTGASNKDVFVCAFGPEQRLNPRFHTTPVQVEVVDISSGELLGRWISGDVPQSISANGDLIAVSSLQPRQGVLPLDVVDVHGQKVAELTGGFAFKEADPSKPLGRVLGFFMGDEELILSPDENIDHTGHHSGDTLQVVSIAGKQVRIEQNIKPRQYGPQGELAVSANNRTVLTLSWYVPARFLAHEGALPASSPELLVFERGASIKLNAALPVHGLGLKASGWLENRRPRVSSNGSVIAIAQDNGVTVLTKGSLSSQHREDRVSHGK
jgi:hypothetical protein